MNIKDSKAYLKSLNHSTYKKGSINTEHSIMSETAKVHHVLPVELGILFYNWKTWGRPIEWAKAAEPNSGIPYFVPIPRS